jgi:excisionase family DNA binding protein
MPSTPTADATVTIAQLAHRWQCSPDTVRREIARGRLRAVRVGRLIRIRERDVSRAERPVTPAEFNYSAGGAA